MYFAFSAFIAFNYESIVLHWEWDWIDTWTGLIRFVLQMGGIGSILFITEIIVENIHIFSKNREIKSLGIQVLDLKAKLYDQDIPSDSPSPPSVSKPEEDSDTSLDQKPS